MKWFNAIVLMAGLLFLCTTARAQSDYPSDAPFGMDPSLGSGSSEADMSASGGGGPSSYGRSYAVPRQRTGAQRLGEWICRDEPPPRGQVITRGGSMGSCVGTCASRYVEPLREHMVICTGQKVPKGYDLLGVTTVSDCD